MIVATKNDWAMALFSDESEHAAVEYAKRLHGENVRLRRISDPKQIEMAEFMIEKMDDWGSD